MLVGRNGPRPAHRVLGEGERAVGRDQTQDMIRKKGPNGQGAEEACGWRGLSELRHYASWVKVVFTNAGCVGLALGGFRRWRTQAINVRIVPRDGRTEVRVSGQNTLPKLHLESQLTTGVLSVFEAQDDQDVKNNSCYCMIFGIWCYTMILSSCF